VNPDLDQPASTDSVQLSLTRRPPVTVLIVDDHPRVRAALGSLLGSSDALCLVGSACSGEEALELAAALCPAVIVMDLAMPGLGGVEAIRRIRAFRQPPVVVALSGSRELMRDAVAAGAAVTVLKDEDPQRLLEVIAAASGG
jgi:DNA-binding NarL/FixJ family response regulator